MSLTKVFLGGVSLGSGFMYYMDRHQGRRRRAMLKDRSIHFVREAGEMIDKGVRDLSHRADGIYSGITSPFREHDLSDEAVVGRVRSKLGRYVSHPHAIEVRAAEGKVTLKGPVLSKEFKEVKDLLSAVRRLPGVRELENRLEAHDDAERIPALQGGRKPKREGGDWRQEGWTPAARLLGAVTGGTTVLYGLGFRNPIGNLLTAAGGALGLRAVANRPLSRILGVGEHKPSITVHKTLEIEAPVDEVYRFWSNFGNFPEFMTEVKEVRVKDGGKRSHWTVAGPMETPVSWEAETTRQEENRLLAWSAVPGAVIRNSGCVRFEESGNEGTRVELDLSYQPPAGVLGHVAARLFGADPKSLLDDSLMQLKTRLETSSAASRQRRTPEREASAHAPGLSVPEPREQEDPEGESRSVSNPS